MGVGGGGRLCCVWEIVISEVQQERGLCLIWEDVVLDLTWAPLIKFTGVSSPPLILPVHRV